MLRMTFYYIRLIVLHFTCFNNTGYYPSVLICAKIVNKLLKQLTFVVDKCRLVAVKRSTSVDFLKGAPYVRLQNDRKRIPLYEDNLGK